MGQGCSCCTSVLVNRSRRRHTGHKRFDFAPKRSWKYKDATLLNEFHEMEMSHDIDSDTEQLIDDNGAAATPSGTTVANSNHHHQQQADLSSDEEEINTGNYRPSGRLVFTEGRDSDSEEELMAAPSTKGGYSQLQLEEESRDRSQSTGSEQIGRFEVWDVVDERRDLSSSTSPQPQQPQPQQQQLLSLDSDHHQDGSAVVRLKDTLAQEQGESSQLMADPLT